MEEVRDLISQIRSVNETAEFNRWCGLEVISAAPGLVEIAMPWRKEAGQYSGFLHAGLVATLIDTACGYAAATMVGPSVLAAHFSVNCLRPAIGERFLPEPRLSEQARPRSSLPASFLHPLRVKRSLSLQAKRYSR